MCNVPARFHFSRFLSLRAVCCRIYCSSTHWQWCKNSQTGSQEQYQLSIILSKRTTVHTIKVCQMYPLEERHMLSPCWIKNTVSFSMWWCHFWDRINTLHCDGAAFLKWKYSVAWKRPLNSSQSEADLFLRALTFDFNMMVMMVTEWLGAGQAAAGSVSPLPNAIITTNNQNKIHIWGCLIRKLTWWQLYSAILHVSNSKPSPFTPFRP